MAIRFACACGASITIPHVLAGHEGRCPSCGVTLTAPPPPERPPPAARATRAPKPGPPARGPQDAFKLLKIECPCGRRVPAPAARVRAGLARCPSCDRVLQAD